LDGNVTVGSVLDNDDDTSSITTDNTDSDSDYDTDDEIDSSPTPAQLQTVYGQVKADGSPIELEVRSSSNQAKSSNLPLCLLLNARSLYNKKSNFKEILYQIGPDLTIVSETWERKRQSIDALLDCEHFKTISYARPKVVSNKQPAGGCAIIYNDSRFKVTEERVSTQEKV
jgi:hypothetical protein